MQQYGLCSWMKFAEYLSTSPLIATVPPLWVFSQINELLFLFICDVTHPHNRPLGRYAITRWGRCESTKYNIFRISFNWVYVTQVLYFPTNAKMHINYFDPVEKRNEKLSAFLVSVNSSFSIFSKKATQILPTTPTIFRIKRKATRTDKLITFLIQSVFGVISSSSLDSKDGTLSYRW